MTQEFNNRPLIVGIAGGAGSGKSTLAQAAADHFGTAAVIVQHDWYYHDLRDRVLEERAKVNFDHPDALDTARLIADIAHLKAGRAIEAPAYDFAQHCRSTDHHGVVPAPVVFVEGILVLAIPALAACFDLKVYVAAEERVRLGRRIARDTAERGRSEAAVRRQFAETVQPMHAQFVAPSRAAADLVLDGCGPIDAAVSALCAAVEVRYRP